MNAMSVQRSVGSVQKEEGKEMIEEILREEYGIEF